MNRVAMMFPGQGAFHAGALRETRKAYAPVEEVLDAVEAVAQHRFGRSLLQTMWNEQNNAAALLKADPDMLQLAIYTLSVAAFELLRAEGIQHDLLLGHSLGEIAALTCAGVFTVQEGAEIICDRIEALSIAAPRDGRMAAVSAGRPKVAEALADFALARGENSDGSQLQIAVENSDYQTVVSGPRQAIEGFIPHCTGRGLSAQQLNSPYAFHHSSMAPAAVEFSRRLRPRASASPRCRVYSPILGRYYRADDDFKGQLSVHLTLSVNFSGAIRRVESDGAGVFIECGALDALTKNVIRVLGPGNGKVFPSLGHTADDLGHVQRITNHFKELQPMKLNEPTSVMRPDFESFWRDRSPVILSQLKAEFVKFLELDHGGPPVEAKPPSGRAVENGVHLNGKPAPVAAVAAVPRAQMFTELVKIYAEAMEYPEEVFKESVELEAELGIDSVKQSEIIRRISTHYKLPPLPANFRAGDYKTMGQIVDFVFAHQGHALTTVS